MRSLPEIFRRPVFVRRLLPMILLAITPCLPVTADTGTPDVLLWSGEALSRAREAWQAGQSSPALQTLVKEGDGALAQAPLSVVAAKRGALPASGDAHDYFSTAPYWWPNPDTADGLPYVRRDGRKNPDFFDGDSRAMSDLITAVRRLSLAWWITGETRYSDHAALLLRAWFIDPETRMNPHLRHAQAIPGVNEGRSIGLIDTARFLDELMDGIRLLESSPSLSARDREGIRAWFSDFLTWCLESEYGRELAAGKNNIATWYFAQIGIYAAFTGREAEVRALYEEKLPALARGQIEPDGRQPEELARTRAMGYSAYNLLAWESVARAASRMGFDYWSPESPVGERLHAAIRYLAAYAAPESAWPHRELDDQPPERRRLAPLFIRARAAGGGRADPVIDAALRQLPGAAVAPAWVRVVYGYTPQSQER